MGYQATIKKQAMWAIFDIKGNASAVEKRISDIGLSLPSSQNTAHAKKGQHLCWIGEKHWLLLAPVEMEDQLIKNSTRKIRPLIVTLSTSAMPIHYLLSLETMPTTFWQLQVR